MKNPVITDSIGTLPITQDIPCLNARVFSSKEKIADTLNNTNPGEGWMFLLILEGECVLQMHTKWLKYGMGLLAIPPETMAERSAFLCGGFRGYLLCIPAVAVSFKWASVRYAALSAKEAEILKDYCLLIRNVITAPESQYSPREMLYLCRAFVASCRQYFNDEILADSNTRSAEIAAEFMRLVERYVQTERELSFYADRLNLSVKYLSAVIASATGKKASALIAEHTIECAKDILMNTRLSITEVAKEMNFKNPSDFCRYFKNGTGVSANTFRRQGTRARAGSRDISMTNHNNIQI